MNLNFKTMHNILIMNLKNVFLGIVCFYFANSGTKEVFFFFELFDPSLSKRRIEFIFRLSFINVAGYHTSADGSFREIESL